MKIDFSILILILIISVYCQIQIPKCDASQKPLIPSFTYSTNGSIDTTTRAHICWNQTHLHFKWFSKDNQIISTYNQCNDPLYNQDAVQVFIAKQLFSDTPATYYQLQVSPKSQLFFANIKNNRWNCSSLETTYMSCTYAQYSAEKTQQGWNAHLAIPLKIINRGVEGPTFFINMFRIDKSSSNPTRYLSWIPNYLKPACFHAPKAFQQIYLKDWKSNVQNYQYLQNYEQKINFE